MPTFDPLAGIPGEGLPVVRVDPLRAPGLVQVGQQLVNPAYSAEVTNALAAQGQAQQDALLAQLQARQAPAAISPEEAQAAEAAAAAAAPTPEELQRRARGSRGIGGALGDTALALGSGLGQLVASVGDLGALIGLVDGDNAVSTFGRDVSESFRGMQTDELQARRTLRDQAIELADGPGAEFAAALAHTIGNPSLLIDLIAETVPSLVGSWGTGALARLGVRTLGRTTGRAVSETLANRVGLGGALAANVVQQSASVGGDTYEGIMDMDQAVWDAYAPYQQLLAAGVEEKEAKQTIALEQARDAALGAMTISAGAQALPGARVIERGLLRIPKDARVVPGGLLQRIGQSGIARFSTGAAGEGLSEAVEEGGGQYMSGLAQQVIDPSVDPARGAGGAAGLGFAAGAALGGPVNVLTGRRPDADAAADQTPDAEAVDTSEDVLTDDIIIAPPPGGLPSENLEFPTGLGALGTRAGPIRTSINAALRATNKVLQTAGALQEDADGVVVLDARGNTTPMSFTAEEFLASPGDVIERARRALAGQGGAAAGRAIDALIEARTELEAEIAGAEQQAQLDIMMDEGTRDAIRRLDDAGRQAVADAMGWDVGAMVAMLDRSDAGDPAAQPEAARGQITQAIQNALTVARDAEGIRLHEAWTAARGQERFEAEEAARRLIREGMREEAEARQAVEDDRFEQEQAARRLIRQGLREDFTQREAEADARFEAEQSARRLIRQGLREDALALDAERAAQEQAAQDFVSGRDPLAADREARAGERAQRMAISGIPSPRDFNPAVVTRPRLRNPIINAELQQAHAAGNAELVRTILSRSTQADARTILSRFNREVQQYRRSISDPKT